MTTTQVKINEPQQVTKPTTPEPIKNTNNPGRAVDTMESMNPQAEGPSSWKVWLANLPWCFGDFFAWLFGIKRDEENQGQVPVSRVPQASTAEIQARLIKECVAPFASASPEYLDTAAITQAKASFAQLDVRAKLEVLQQLLRNENCTHPHLLPFFKLLTATGANNPLAQLQGFIEAQSSADDTRKGEVILETNVKDDLVIRGVDAYILDEQDKADIERQNKILANHAGPDFPAADVCVSSVGCFVTIESDKRKLETLDKLMQLPNISDAYILKFVATLPARPKALVIPAEGGATVTVVPVKLLRDRLFDKLKEAFGPMEEMVKNRYEKAVVASKRANIPFNEPVPSKFDQLEDYFVERHRNLNIRQKVDEIIQETLNEIA